MAFEKFYFTNKNYRYIILYQNHSIYIIHIHLGLNRKPPTEIRRRGAICITINDFEECKDDQRNLYYSDQNSDNENCTATTAVTYNKKYKKATINFQCCHNMFGKRRKHSGMENCNRKFPAKYNNFDSSAGEGQFFFYAFY